MSALIHPISESGAVVVADAAASLPFPPVSHAALPSHWSDSDGAVGEFDLLLSANGAANLTSAVFYAVFQVSGAIADDDVDTVDFANDELDITSHGLLTGDGPLRLTTSDTLPTGLATDTDYWVILVDSGTIQLAASLEDAFAGTAVTFGDAGTGTHTITDTGTTPKRTRYAELCAPGTGTVALTAQKAYLESRCKASPRAVSYAMSATISANNVTAKIVPIIDRQ